MKFFLKSSKQEGKAPLFFEVNKRNPKIKVQICTNVTVSIQAWQAAQKCARNLTKYISTPEGANVMRLLSLIENAVNNIFATGAVGGSSDKHIIENAVNEIAFADERQRIQEQEERAAAERAAELQKYCNIIDFYNYYLVEMVQGRAQSRSGKPYKETDIKNFRTFGKVLQRYMERRTERTFADINPTFANGFVQFLKGCNYMKNTISGYVGNFRTLCRLAAKYGYNNNLISLQVWTVQGASKEEKKAAVYLTEEELTAIYEMPLLGNMATVRDIFFVGSAISQRWSDYHRINKNMFHEVGGVMFLTITQQKTAHEVVIPLTDERVIRTLQKYDYNLPFVPLVTFNMKITHIMKELSVMVDSLREQYETTPTKWERENTPELINKDGKIIKEKWQIVSSHTARRSGVTNMYKSGALDKEEMKSISGHTTDRIFESYIKLGALEQAKRIADKLTHLNPAKRNTKEI